MNVGATVAVPGDLNGDGYADFVVRSGANAVFVFFGDMNLASKSIPDAILAVSGSAIAGR